MAPGTRPARGGTKAAPCGERRRRLAPSRDMPTAAQAATTLPAADFRLKATAYSGLIDDLGKVGTVLWRDNPNPAKNVVTIGNPQNLELEKADIFDLTGRLVHSYNLKGMATSKTLDVNNLAAATYVVVIKGKYGQITKRLLKE